MRKYTDFEISKEYPYLYETHLHTNQGSACASNTGYDMAKAAKEYGYAGIIVTEHNWGGNTCIPRNLSWDKWIEGMATGYRDALKVCDDNFDVFWGYEAGYDGTEFLIYGASIEWLKAHPEIKDADIQTQYEMIHNIGGLVIHAHPFREEPYIPEIRLFPEYVDGVEGINATHTSPLSYHHKDPEFDKLAIEYANKHGLPMTTGSDIHSTNLFGGGVAFKTRIRTIEEYCKNILHGDYILTNGNIIYDKQGKILK